MKNEKVIVMEPQDVAAMRNAYKAAEDAYFEAKVGALKFVAEEMRYTGEEYTAADLASMSGLTSGEIAAQMLGGGGHCRAASAAGLGHGAVQSSVRLTQNKYVRMMPDGEIKPDQCITVTQRKTTYKMRPNHNR